MGDTGAGKSSADIVPSEIGSLNGGVSELPKRFHDYVWHLITIPFRHEFVPRTSDCKQFGLCRDKLQRRYHLVDGAETIPRTVNEKRGSFEIWEMPGP
jgi:hypothetical protein